MKTELQAEPGRLDQVLARLLEVPRADVQRAIVAKRVTVDGQLRPKSFRLEGGENLVADMPDTAELLAEGPPLEVRYRDEHLMVVAKPAGLVTHPTEAHRTGTMVNRLLGMDVPLSTVGGWMRPGIVHRLDAGTSGLVIIASTDEAHEGLAAMLHDHLVQRTYMAMVRGVVEHDLFIVDAPLQRRRAKIVVKQSSGRPAETGFEVVERFEVASLLRATPRTGRTHQIRVHLSAIGHPIIGDRSYGGGGDVARRLGL
ncbi:MAG: RluA family pseudouridine synthase, partial [Actinobacteria bacterium]|nr:RluA family pseudouridine synthase [Actinomycetota bacterium]